MKPALIHFSCIKEKNKFLLMQKSKEPSHDYNIFAFKTARPLFAQIRFVRTNFLAK